MYLIFFFLYYLRESYRRHGRKKKDKRNHIIPKWESTKLHEWYLKFFSKKHGQKKKEKKKGEEQRGHTWRAFEGTNQSWGTVRSSTVPSKPPLFVFPFPSSSSCGLSEEDEEERRGIVGRGHEFAAAVERRKWVFWEDTVWGSFGWWWWKKKEAEGLTVAEGSEALIIFWPKAVFWFVRPLIHLVRNTAISRRLC